MADSVRMFWRRISDGVAVQQLWAQFNAEARASYEMYSAEVDATPQEGESRPKRYLRIARGLFWAMMMKLSPGRRVLFLIALVLLAFPGFELRDERAGVDFQMPNLAFLGGIALLILFALELADRVMMKRDLQIAREIQGWLMPAAAPAIAGVDIAFASRPANTVAGDYYDAFMRRAGGTDRLLLVVADVAGKSVPAALLMATLQASLKTLAALPSSLLELTGSLNQYVCAQNLGGHRFTTAFLAELDPVTGRIDYVNAGHNWPVLRRVSGAVERLEAGGLPLGIRPEAQYECGSTSLGTGDVLVIFTDGLVEAENREEQEYGEGRLLAIVNGLVAKNAAEALARLMASVEAFAGLARQHDDITCMVVRR